MIIMMRSLHGVKLIVIYFVIYEDMYFYNYIFGSGVT